MHMVTDYSNYFFYLLDILRIERDDELIPNLTRMFERSYYWKNPIDSGMIGHVNELRANAIRIGGVNPTDIPNRDASVLEIIVSLSILIDLKLLYDETDPGGNVPSYFTDLIECLGFDCDISGIDSAIDKFLDGKRRIFDSGATLWQQCNLKYSNYFDVLTGDE